MDLSPDTNKEYVWCAKLDKTKKVHQWGGQDDGSLEQIVLKKACLGVGAVENERNIIQVTSFNHKAEKVEVCICSLRAGLKEDETLSDLTILPPAVFKLVAGNGPVHIVANHMTLSDYLASDDESDISGDLSDDEMNKNDDDDDDKEDEEEEEAVKAIKSLAKAQKKAEASFDDEDDEDEDDEDDDEDDEDFDDEDDEDEIDLSEEEPEAKPQGKKRKAEEVSKLNGDGKKKKSEDSLATPKKADPKKTPKKEPKTPLQQKENKTPVSAKKTPKTYSSVSELLAAIKKYPGGKPKKEDKFSNWVKHTFKVSNDEWIKKLWKAHKADLGL